MMTLQNIVQIYCKDVFQRSTYLCQHLSGGMYKQCLTTLTYKLLMLSIAFKKKSIGPVGPTMFTSGGATAIPQ